MDDDRLFNRRGRRHFRRTYSVNEVKVGVAVGVVLIAIVAWIVWRGGQPDPELAQTAADLFEPKKALDRGPLPAPLAPAGWSEQSLSSFDTSNLYEKINGRESYYKNFGFQMLYFVSLSNGTGGRSIDVELYDLGNVQNALGAMSGEVPEGAKTRFVDRARVSEGRNSTLLAQGKYYARLIGSEESEAIKAALTEVSAKLLAALPAEDLPFGVKLFAGLLGLPAERVGYERENAFSFGFAKDVHVGRLDDESELFVVTTNSATAAASLAEQFQRGFKEYGEDAGTTKGVVWVRDRYLSSISGAVAEGTMVAGIRGAPDRTKAEDGITKLRDALAKVDAPALKPKESDESEKAKTKVDEY
jgi:hypothetical protein